MGYLWFLKTYFQFLTHNVSHYQQRRGKSVVLGQGPHVKVVAAVGMTLPGVQNGVYIVKVGYLIASLLIEFVYLFIILQSTPNHSQ